MIYEDLRAIHEDVERLEDAIAERVMDEPQHIRTRLVRDHEIANFLERVQTQSQRALRLYDDDRDVRMQEVQMISTGDTYATFYDEYRKIKEFHKRNPNEPVENTERAYKKIEHGGVTRQFAGDVDGMFTGEESFGRFFDLILHHEEYLNLPGIKGGRKYTYLQYLDVFDQFVPPGCRIEHDDKMTDEYFAYVGSLAQYLESFMQRTRPLEDLPKVLKEFDDDFAREWDDGTIPGWEPKQANNNATRTSGPVTEGTGSGVWCAACQKEFSNDNVYKAHLTGKKHIKAAAATQGQPPGNGAPTAPPPNGASSAQALRRLKERAVAEREHRIRKLAAAMSTERDDTKVNVERKHGMTDRERQQELAALLEEETAMAGGPYGGGGNGETAGGDDADAAEDDEEKLYNPLRLPLAWDGKPIPFWLYKLHGLGVEFHCEICGNFVYMGRRAFDKHFSEARHLRGLSFLGIDRNTSLFREITRIEEAQKLWDKLQRDKARELERQGGEGGEDIEEMEDDEGNVLSKKTYDDLKKMGYI